MKAALKVVQMVSVWVADLGDRMVRKKDCMLDVDSVSLMVEMMVALMVDWRENTMVVKRVVMMAAKLAALTDESTVDSMVS